MLRVLVLAACSFALATCSPADAPSTGTPNVSAYFFPTTNGLIYSYSRTTTHANRITTDTLNCSLSVGQLPNDQNSLVDLKSNNVLYYFNYAHDASRYAATLSAGDTTIYALEGSLLDSDTWIADPVHGTVGTVIDHIDDYYPPKTSADVHFPDVIVVEYKQIDDPNGQYMLRFFARGRGLIREAEIVTPGNTEISSLQVLSISSGH